MGRRAAVRIAWRVLFTAAFYFSLSVWSTNYRGHDECYERATWDGITFHHTGETICFEN